MKPLPPLLVASLALAACKSDAPPAAVVTESPDDVERASEEATPGGDEPGDGRKLWFADGPGREAILARERRDWATASAKLDELLAEPSLSADDRGAAQWLRGLEDLREDRFEAAADRFAEARKAPGLATVDLRLRVLEAHARMAAGQPEVALALVDGQAAEGTPHAGDIEMIRGNALLRTDDFAGAQQAYEAYLKISGGTRRAEARCRLAQALVAQGGPDALKQAVEQYEKVLLAVPLSDYGEEAEQALKELRPKAGVKASHGFARELELSRAEAMLSRRQYGATIKAADEIIAKAGPGAARCRALYAKGSAIFKQRKRGKARPVFDKAAKSCAKAGKAHVDTEVKARYQAGRGLYADGSYTRAAKAFAALATDHADNSYADDAWILAGESWQEAGKDATAREAYRKALAVDGDMRPEARRRLLVMAFSAKDHDDALQLTEQGLKAHGEHPRERAKLHYFRGRALAELSRADEATAAWIDAVRELPLGYASLQALSRLREQGPEALDGALTVLSKAAADAGGGDALPDSPAARRALLLARLGLGEEAREELSVARVDGWPAAMVLNGAGLFSEAQRVVANLGASWRHVPPVGEAKTHWQTAYPQPFGDLVRAGEEAHAVPPLLTWAIMQTESRFNPTVTSWAGARGLVQLMPATAKGLAEQAGVELDDLDKLFDPAVNLDLGQRYLGNLTARFGGGPAGAALAIPSYNGGAGNVDKWLDRRGDWSLDLFIESIPFDETRKYTQSVLGRWMTYRWLYAKADPADRFPYLPLETPKRTQ